MRVTEEKEGQVRELKNAPISEGLNYTAADFDYL